MLRKIMLGLGASAVIGAVALAPGSASACDGDGCWHHTVVRTIVHVTTVYQVAPQVTPIWPFKRDCCDCWRR